MAIPTACWSRQVPAADRSVPDSAGVPAGYAAATLLAEYNDIESVRRLLEENEGEVACIVVEPVGGQHGRGSSGGGIPCRTA